MSVVVISVILIFATLLQNSIVNQISVLYGAADLVLLVLVTWILQTEEKQYWIAGIVAGYLVGISSALPVWLTVLEYTIVVLLVTFFQRRVWQVPIWLLLTSVIISTMLLYGIEFGYLGITGVSFEISTVFNLFLLPSSVLNIILALPVYGVMGEVGKLLNPDKVET